MQASWYQADKASLLGLQFILIDILFNSALQHKCKSTQYMLLHVAGDNKCWKQISNSIQVEISLGYACVIYDCRFPFLLCGDSLGRVITLQIA